MNEDVLLAAEHVMMILGLEHPTPEKKIHPGVTGTAIFYMQKYTRLHATPPSRIAAKENGNIVMVWEETDPQMAIDIQDYEQSADIIMESKDGQRTKKKDTEATDATALTVVTNILKAVVARAFEEESDDPQEDPEVPVVA